MFSELLSTALPYSAPWERETTDERLRALDADQPAVAWLYEKPDTSTFRYRIYNMVDCLRQKRSGSVSASWFSVDEIPALLHRISQVDVLVLVRVRYDAEVGRLIAVAREKGVKIIFDCDDLVFSTEHIHLLLDTLDQDTTTQAAWDFWFAYCGRLEATAKLCDAGIATNSYLAGFMKNVVRGEIGIVPNFLNRAQQHVSEGIFASKIEGAFESEKPTAIGYFSGTPSHNRDFRIIVPALDRLLQREPDVVLYVVGFMEHLDSLSRHGDRLRCVPLHDWINLQRLIGAVDINVAPLQQNEFTNCKSELKYFEAAIVGTWSMTSPTYTFRHAIRSTRMGSLVQTENWHTALEQSLELVRNQEKTQQFAKENFEYACANYGWDTQVESVIHATLGKSAEHGEPARSLTASADSRNQTGSRRFSRLSPYGSAS